MDTNTSQLVSLGGGWQHSLNIVDTRLDTSGQFRRVRGSQGESGGEATESGGEAIESDQDTTNKCL